MLLPFIKVAMSTEWNPPEDDAEFTAWMDNFIEKLPKYAKELGVTQEELDELRKQHTGFRAAFFREIQERLGGLRQRLKALCLENDWPAVLGEAFPRIPITREPDRSELLRLLERWIAGIERAHGGKVQPKLSWRYCPEGIQLDFTIPKPCECTSVFYRQKGRAEWKHLITNTQPHKRLFTAPQYLQDDEEKKAWPGRTLEFVACGWFEDASFGFPSETVAAMVPLSYPVAAEA